MSSRSKRRRLRNLLELDSHCFWCGCAVILGTRNYKRKDHVKCPPNMATLDHIISRNNKNWEKGKRNRLVLSCSKCNQKRERKMLPIEELWHRSGRYPLGKRNEK